MPATPGITEALRRKLLANCLVLAVLAASGVILRSPALCASLIPKCPVHEYLGWLCPGCGATRAITCLLHGQVREAATYNPLFVIMLPGFVVLALRIYWRALRPGTFEWPRVPAGSLYATLTVTAIFTVIRNLT